MGPVAIRARESGLHAARLPDDDVCAFDYPSLPSIAITSPIRTAVDLAATVGFETGVVAMEHLLFRGATKDEFADCLARGGRRVGYRNVEDALRFAGSKSESPGESLSRLCFRRWPELPEPDQQVIVRLSTGMVIRADFRWLGGSGPGLVGEFDGLIKYEDGRYAATGSTMLLREKARHDALTNDGFVVVRWGWRELRTDPGQLRKVLTGAMKRAGIPLLLPR